MWGGGAEGGASSQATPSTDQMLLEIASAVDMSDIANKKRRLQKTTPKAMLQKKPAASHEEPITGEASPAKKQKSELSNKSNKVYSNAYRQASREGHSLSECQAIGREAAANFRADYSQS